MRAVAEDASFKSRRRRDLPHPSPLCVNTFSRKREKGDPCSGWNDTRGVSHGSAGFEWETTVTAAQNTSPTLTIDGIVPVMLTPFTEGGDVDFQGLDRLVDWYLANGADALFAVCQSSEMQFLTLPERVAIARRVAERVAGRVPVIASGHVSDAREAQAEELSAVAATGVDAVVFVTNRLDQGREGGAVFRRNLDWLVARLPDGLPLGLYECPAPFRRLLADDELAFCAGLGRFVVLKDVSCDLPTVRRRVALLEGTGLVVNNANAAIAFDAMRAGSRGFCGVFTNFHPDLYAWLYHHGAADPDLAQDLASFLALSGLAEPMGYPALAKIFHTRLGTFGSARSRAVTYDVRERHWGLDPVLDTIRGTADRFRERIAAIGRPSGRISAVA